MQNIFGAAVLLIACVMIAQGADEPPAEESQPTREPLKIEVIDVSVTTFAEIPGLSLSVRLSNPNDGPVHFIGYTPDSFDPPLMEGQISPIHSLEFRKDGKWVGHPIGWCGTGMGAIPLTKKDKPTFSIFAAGVADWEAVRVGVTVLPGPDYENAETFKVVWSPAQEPKSPKAD